MCTRKSITALLAFIAWTYSRFCLAQTDSKSLIIGQSDVLHSAILKQDRVIHICLPEGYRTDDTARYPVIYILDGGMDEDFLHVAGIVRFYTQPWIAGIPPSVVVGISGNSRKRDFTFAVDNTDFIEKEGFRKSGFPEYGGSGAYMDFIEKELQPYIDKTYRTGAGKTIIGESLAGLLATEILIKRPYLFDDYIIISPSLWWGGRSLLRNKEKRQSAHLSKKINVYLGVPNKDEDLRMYRDSEELYRYLNGQMHINLVFDYMPDELHATVMHQGVYNAFKKLYPKATNVR